MSLSKKQSDFMYMVGELINFTRPLEECYGVYVKVTEWNRTRKQQSIYVSEGSSRTMESKHLIGLAVDFAPIGENGKDVDYGSPILDEMGAFWESIGGVWGGNWKGFVDRPHFEYNNKLRVEYLARKS